jgi:serine/threonine protein kinase
MSHVDILRQDRSPPDLQLPPGHVWAWIKELGAGGEGTAHLWAQLDESQKLVERIVIRNTDVRPSQRFREGPHKGEWIELHIQQQLVPDGSTEAYTVPVLAASRIPGTTGFRSYMHYYSKGDLYTVISDHIRYRPLPEPFLWFTLHHLANALVAMDERFRDSGRNKPVVVHNDIKPGNILMGHPGSFGRDVDYVS